MNKEIHIPTQEISDFSANIQRVNTEQEIKDYFAFSDPILKVDWGEVGPPEEYTPEYIANNPDFTAIFEIKDNSGQIIAGAKVKKIDESTKLRLGLDNEPYANKVGALLEYTAVKEEYRNQGLLIELTAKRAEWAKNHEVDYLCSEMEITNPISIYTKLKDGFKIFSIKEPGEGVLEPYFVAIKPIDQNPIEMGYNKLSPTWKEVEINNDSYEELKTLFAEGWVGVDIKGLEEDPADLQMPWTLILEKSEPSKKPNN